MTKTILLLPFLLICLLCPAASAADNAENIDDVLTRLTELKGKTEWKQNFAKPGSEPEYVDHQRNYILEIKGKTVAGAGTVSKLAGSPSDTGPTGKVLILAPGNNPPKGYNVVLIVNQEDRAGLKPGDKVTFTGTMGNVSNWHGTSIDVKGSFRKAD